MARKGRQAVRNGGWPAWLLVLIGIIVGAIAMGIVNHTGHMPISRNATPQPNPQSAQSSDGAGIAAQTQSNKPKYDFYSVLPEKEVVIPDAQIDAQAKAEKQQAQQQPNTDANQDNTAGSNNTSTATATTSNGGARYLLQVGSFPNASDAEALKAKLALQGFRAEIQPITINGKTWNRVRLGPFSSASSLETAKNKLEAAGINAMALKEQ